MTQTPGPIYEAFAAEVEDLYQQASAGTLKQWRPVASLAERLVQTVRREGAGLFELGCHPVSDKPLSHHIVHTAVLAVLLGQSLKLSAEKLLKLAQSSLVFDLGMMAMKGNALKDIQKHPEAGAKLLAGLPEVPEEVVRTVAEHHERDDGSGYPKGLKEEKIHLFGRIVGLADTFCNMIHVAPGQRRLSLYEAIRELLKARNLFDKKCLKLLFENISFYPKGTWVLLSTGERGVVIEENPGNALRPVVTIYPEEEEEAGELKRSVDLRQLPSIFVKRVLLEEDLAKKGTTA